MAFFSLTIYHHHIYIYLDLFYYYCSFIDLSNSSRMLLHLEVYCCQAVLLGFVKRVSPHERNIELGWSILMGAGSSFFFVTDSCYRPMKM